MEKIEKKKNTITAISIFGLLIAYLLIIAINNILYQSHITVKFMLYCSLYGLPFVIIAYATNHYLIKYSTRKEWSAKYERRITALQLILVIFIAIIITIIAFLIFDPNKHKYFKDLIIEPYFQISIIADIMINIFIFIFTKYLNQLERATVREQHIKEIESEMMHVRYQQLKSQINPHFLFNSLNNIVSLINIDQTKAIQFTKQLTNIYRYILNNEKRDLVMVSEEIAFSKQYANIMKIRHGDGLEINFPDFSVLFFMYKEIIPTSLQILIENACKHNIISAKKTLKIDITINDKGIIVLNNKNPRPTPTDSIGLGLESLNEKYLILSNQSISVENTNTYFKVTIPFIEL